MSAAFARAGAPSGPTAEELEALIARGTVNLLEADGALLGLIVLEPFEDHVFVVALAVDPAHRRRGVGRRLMAFAESEARRRNLGVIRLFADRRAEPSLRFYRRLGFAPAPPLSDGGDEVHLVKRIGRSPG